MRWRPCLLNLWRRPCQQWGRWWWVWCVSPLRHILAMNTVCWGRGTRCCTSHIERHREWRVFQSWSRFRCTHGCRGGSGGGREGSQGGGWGCGGCNCHTGGRLDVFNLIGHTWNQARLAHQFGFNNNDSNNDDNNRTVIIKYWLWSTQFKISTICFLHCLQTPTHTHFHFYFLTFSSEVDIEDVWQLLHQNISHLEGTNNYPKVRGCQHACNMTACARARAHTHTHTHEHTHTRTHTTNSLAVRLVIHKPIFLFYPFSTLNIFLMSSLDRKLHAYSYHKYKNSFHMILWTSELEN